ncbi:MAG: signal recognition particle receptor subunit alpha, partial [Thioalkalispiraceae bacterium]
MFGFKKSRNPSTPEKTDNAGLFARLKQGLSRTRSGFSDGIANLVMGKKSIDDELLEDIETLLLTADVGVEATSQIIDELTAKVSRKELTDPQALLDNLKQQLAEILAPSSQPLHIDA